MYLGSLNSRPRQEKSQKEEKKDGAYGAFKKAEEREKKRTKTGGTRVGGRNRARKVCGIAKAAVGFGWALTSETLNRRGSRNKSLKGAVNFEVTGAYRGPSSRQHR